jgi:hypothetical protein
VCGAYSSVDVFGRGGVYGGDLLFGAGQYLLSNVGWLGGKYIRWVDGGDQITLLTCDKLVVDEKSGRLRPCVAIWCRQLGE